MVVGQNYQKPIIPLPNHWFIPTPLPQTQKTALSLEEMWWHQFNDPTLNAFIAQAIANNPDLRIANARIANARAQYRYTRAGLGPTLNFYSSGTRQANQTPFPDKLAPPGIEKPFNVYQLGFDASWEIDLFGKQQRSLEVNQANLQAEQASSKNTDIRLLAEVAKTYFMIRNYQQQMMLAQKQFQLARHQTQILHQQFKIGSITGVTLTQAMAQQQQIYTQIPYYQNLLAQAESSMDQLLGKHPGTTHCMASPPKLLPIFNKRLILIAPACVIANRPDVRMAERTLAAATAQHNVAIAERFPQISLSSFVGLLNTHAYDLLQASSQSWTAGAKLLWPIFNGGKLSYATDAAYAKQKIALANYQKTVIAALSDVNYAITAYQLQENHRAALQLILHHRQHEWDIARQCYQHGIFSLFTVLKVEQAFYTAKSTLMTANALTLQKAIAVYKSLGGRF